MELIETDYLINTASRTAWFPKHTPSGSYQLRWASDGDFYLIGPSDATRMFYTATSSAKFGVYQ